MARIPQNTPVSATVSGPSTAESAKVCEEQEQFHSQNPEDCAEQEQEQPLEDLLKEFGLNPDDPDPDSDYESEGEDF